MNNFRKEIYFFRFLFSDPPLFTLYTCTQIFTNEVKNFPIFHLYQLLPRYFVMSSLHNFCSNPVVVYSFLNLIPCLKKNLYADLSNYSYQSSHASKNYQACNYTDKYCGLFSKRSLDYLFKLWAQWEVVCFQFNFFRVFSKMFFLSFIPNLIFKDVVSQNSIAAFGKTCSHRQTK